MIKQSDTKYALSDKEVTLLKMGLTEWMEARAAGKYSCVDIATAMVKRTLYLQEVQKMQQFMYWGTFDWIKVVMKEAQKFDYRAAKKGISAIAPMYCYPIPIKGTVSS
jgi:mevalonate kinase